MRTIIHARKQPDGTFVYRLWSTNLDRYDTEELDEEGLLLQLRFNAGYEMVMLYEGMLREQPQRLAHAQAWGTSELVGHTSPTILSAPWKTERCRVCSMFHHDFERGASSARSCCRVCGEPIEYKGHEPPCEKEDENG